MHAYFSKREANGGSMTKSYHIIFSTDGLGYECHYIPCASEKEVLDKLTDLARANGENFLFSVIEGEQIMALPTKLHGKTTYIALKREN